MKLFFVAIVLAVLGTSSGVVLTKCQLANALLNNGFPRPQLRDWVCLVQSESNFNTNALNTKNSNGSKDYGLFQINNRYWCGEGKAGGDCKVACSSLRDDDIADDLKCAQLIFRRHGFNAWYGWKNKCNGKPLPTVDECFRAGK